MPPISDLEALTRMVVAMAIGAALGLERARAEKPAGMRTYMLVAEGAALFMICALMLTSQLRANGIVSDPGRIASTVVQGVGFIAGGVILTTGRHVRGMTTAAGIWVAAALGLMVGAGFLVVAATAALTTVAALVVLHQIEVRWLPWGQKSSLSETDADGPEDRLGGGSR